MSMCVEHGYTAARARLELAEAELVEIKLRKMRGALTRGADTAREPLSDEQIAALVPNAQAGWTREQYCQWMARVVERAHGIGAEGVDDLKHCPHCGEQPMEHAIEAHAHSAPIQALGIPDHAGSHCIECACGAGMIDGTREAVLARWNRRAPTEAAPAPAHSKSEYKRRVALGDPNVLPPAQDVRADLTKLAQECGATVYRNRSNPQAPAIAFGDESWAKFCAALSAQPAPAEPSDAQMQKNAARYEWLKKGGLPAAGYLAMMTGSSGWDAAIDAAMSKTAAEGAVDPDGVDVPRGGEHK